VPCQPNWSGYATGANRSTTPVKTIVGIKQEMSSKRKAFLDELITPTNEN